MERYWMMKKAGDHLSISQSWRAFGGSEVGGRVGEYDAQ